MHGLDAIHDEVQDDLLQLHLVALHGREVFVELCLKGKRPFLTRGSGCGA